MHILKVTYTHRYVWYMLAYMLAVFHIVENVSAPKSTKYMSTSIITPSMSTEDLEWGTKVL